MPLTGQVSGNLELTSENSGSEIQFSGYNEDLNSTTYGYRFDESQNKYRMVYVNVNGVVTQSLEGETTWVYSVDINGKEVLISNNKDFVYITKDNEGS